MRRSEINRLIGSSIDFLRVMNFHLPPWAFRKPFEWKGQYLNCSEIVDNMLGWDLTDFGSGNFSKCGLVLFTLRNGNPVKDRKPYAEKIMIVDELQETPMHFHWKKMEDIINRGGGNLVIELYNSDKGEGLSDSPVTVKSDGIIKKLEAGASIILRPGASITLESSVYHRFYGEKGKGKVLVGEISSVNDDSSDNRFLYPVGRFPEVIEDVEPLHLLATDYRKYL